MPTPDQRLIEDYIPIEEISKEARREKSIRKGHISTLHLWWARRPLVASRAAVYGALVPAAKDKKAAKEASEFVAKLCKYPGSPDVIKQANQHILQAHAERLTEERGELVTVEDIEAGRATRPKVLDMFAGGGAIPLEALRLGCEAYALDLNPVAHLIQLCTLIYPQQFGAPNPAAKGCAKDGTWAGLAEEVEHWGKWVLKQVRAEIGDLYPPIPDPQAEKANNEPTQLNMNLAVQEKPGEYKKGMLTPVAYLWTRTVTCKNPACGGIVPLARQTWLAKKKGTKKRAGRYIALQPIIDPKATEKKVKYKVVEATTVKGLGFDPSSGSQGGNAACPFCGTVNDSAYVKAQGQIKQIDTQPIALICIRPKEKGKIYLSVDETPETMWPNKQKILKRINNIDSVNSADMLGNLTIPNEPIETNPRSMDTANYGFESWSEIFIPRQLLAMLTFTKYVRVAAVKLEKIYVDNPERYVALSAYLAIVQSRLTDFNNSFCTLLSSGGRGVKQMFVRQSVAMVWDFAESNPLNPIAASWSSMLNTVTMALKKLGDFSGTSIAFRGSATEMPFDESSFDAIITDPPYYDNVTYSNLSDFFYVWLKRTVGHIYPEHFSSSLTPKKKEAIAAPYRHKGNRANSKHYYEELMAAAFKNAEKVLKPNAPMVIVYAHKTTLGWSTLIEALREARFMVTEAWPLDTEQSHRTRAIETASLASSIFLTTRRRTNNLWC